MILPYGSESLHPLFVNDTHDRQELLKEATRLPAVLISSAAAANAVMMGSGYFNPLSGFMNKADALSVSQRMQMSDGLFWPVPILNIVPDGSSLRSGSRIALNDPNVEGNPVLAIQHIESVEEFSADEMKIMTQHIFRTQDRAHPGVAQFNSFGRVAISGPIQVLNFSYFDTDFPDTFRTAYQIRKEMQDLGWQKVVAFQTRNPMHRAHEELCRMAYHDVGADGILIHMLLGKLNAGDIPADVRDACIRKMVENYFEPSTVLVTGYGYDMLYAGPREAVLHAIFRQNAGCTHLIVGRDHAGVGNYYGPFDAQRIFNEEVPANALRIQIYKADHTAWSKKLGKVVMMSDVPDHGSEDFILLSGTKVRELLSVGQFPPSEIMRPEVARILIEYYQHRI